MITDYDKQKNNSFMPYRCPICFNPVLPCMTNAISNKKSYGCMTMSCKAPIFEQKDNESKFTPLIEWNKWVINYRKEHPNFHREFMCKGCELEGVSCDFYDDNVINCCWWRSKEIEELQKKSSRICFKFYQKKILRVFMRLLKKQNNF